MLQNEKEFLNLLPKLKSEFVREAYDAVWATALSLNRTLSSCEHDNNADCLNKSFHKSFQKQFVDNFQYIQFKGTSVSKHIAIRIYKNRILKIDRFGNFWGKSSRISCHSDNGGSRMKKREDLWNVSPHHNS